MKSIIPNSMESNNIVCDRVERQMAGEEER